MNHDRLSGMAEATRITRAGQLAEATALIQRILAGAPSEAPPADVAAPPPLPAPAATPNATAPRTPSPTKRQGLRATLRRLAERARALDVDEVAPVTPAAKGARFLTASYRDAVGTRDYKLYVPSSASAGAAGPRPLVVMLHGCTQSPDDFARGTAMNAAAEEAGVLVAYPAQPSAANPNRCWNWFRPEDQRRDAGEPALVAGIVRQVIADHDVDPARVYVAGLSAGGATAAILGAEYPEVFAAVGVHSGLPHGAAQDLPSALAAMRQGARGAGAQRATRTIVFHGDADRTVNPANATAVAAQATAAAGVLQLRVERGEAGGRAYSRALHRDASGRTACEQWTLHGAGHAWSGGDAAGSHADPLGPDASREMLRFFLEA